MTDYYPALKKHVVISLCTSLITIAKDPISYKIEYNDTNIHSILPTTLTTSQIKIDAFTVRFEDVIKLLNSKQYQVNSIEIHISHNESSQHTIYKVDINKASLYISNPESHNPWSPERLKERGYYLGCGGIRKITTTFS